MYVCKMSDLARAHGCLMTCFGPLPSPRYLVCPVAPAVCMYRMICDGLTAVVTAFTRMMLVGSYCWPPLITPFLSVGCCSREDLSCTSLGCPYGRNCYVISPDATGFSNGHILFSTCLFVCPFFFSAFGGCRVVGLSGGLMAGRATDAAQNTK